MRLIGHDRKYRAELAALIQRTRIKPLDRSHWMAMRDGLTLVGGIIVLLGLCALALAILLGFIGIH